MKGDVQLGTGIDPGNMDIMLGGIANLPNMPLFHAGWLLRSHCSVLWNWNRNALRRSLF